MFDHSSGYAASLFIGVSLGMIGGGGSILTIPILVYLFGVEPVMATASSLFIVGTTSLIGVLPKFREGLVDFKVAFLFGLPSVVAVFVTRRFVIPAIPAEVVRIGDFVVTKGILLLLVFAVLMILASFSMIFGQKLDANPVQSGRPTFFYPKVFGYGAAVGFLTGLVGAGGGFMIIPTLVLLCKVPMKSAVGTALLIIAAKSLLGLTGDAAIFQSIDWFLLIAILGCASAGILVGNHFNRRLSEARLKKGFGWFVLTLGIYMLIRESLAAFV